MLSALISLQSVGVIWARNKMKLFEDTLINIVEWPKEDMKKLYEGEQLLEKSSSYRQWVDSVNHHPVQHPGEVSYWKMQLSALSPLQNKGQQSKIISYEFEKEITEELLQKASRAYNTETRELLLTALACAYKEINNQGILGVTLEGDGRENTDSSIDTSRTSGNFAFHYPARLELQETLKESIEIIL